MTDYYRIIEKGKRRFIVDINGDIVQPEKAKTLSEAVIKTAEDKSYVYVGPREDGVYKIGFTTRPDERPGEWKLTRVDHLIECPLYGELSASKIEKMLHNLFKETGQHVEGEFFDLGSHGLRLIQERFLSPEKVLSEVPILLDHFDKIAGLLKKIGRNAFIVLLARVYNNQVDDLHSEAITYAAHNAVRYWLKKGKVEKAEFVAGAIALTYELSFKAVSQRHELLID
jgi:hypothetical protein